MGLDAAERRRVLRRGRWRVHEKMVHSTRRHQ
jgi:hypothetical protein